MSWRRRWAARIVKHARKFKFYCDMTWGRGVDMTITTGAHVFVPKASDMVALRARFCWMFAFVGPKGLGEGYSVHGLGMEDNETCKLNVCTVETQALSMSAWHRRVVYTSWDRPVLARPRRSKANEQVVDLTVNLRIATSSNRAPATPHPDSYTWHVVYLQTPACLGRSRM